MVRLRRAELGGWCQTASKRETNRQDARAATEVMRKLGLVPWRSFASCASWRFDTTLLGAVVVSALCGCTHVAPYERGALARPDMTTADIEGPAAHHALSVHEGATKGGAVAESGCGCN